MPLHQAVCLAPAMRLMPVTDVADVARALQPLQPLQPSRTTRWLNRLAGVVLFVLLATPAADAAQKSEPKPSSSQAATTATSPWRAPTIERWTTPQGLQVYWVPNAALPIVDARLVLDAGARLDPDDKRGLASLTAAMLTRGADALDEGAYADQLADLGGEIGAGADYATMSVSLRSLSLAPQWRGMSKLFLQTLAAPRFDAAVLARERRQSIDDLKAALQLPGTLAGRALVQRLFVGHARGRLVTPQTLGRIEATDVRAFWREHASPNAAYLVLVGALEREAVAAFAEQVAQALAGNTPNNKPEQQPGWKPFTSARNLLTHDPRREALPNPFGVLSDASQAHVYIAQVGVSRADPDYFPLIVGNYVLGGGGFTSRLMQAVRVDAGLAYSVYSSFDADLDAGAFTIALQTKVGQSQRARDIALAVLHRFVAEGVTEAELRDAKDYLVNSQALRLDGNRRLLEVTTSIALHQLPLDYLDRFEGLVRAVTREQVQAAFARLIHFDELVTVDSSEGHTNPSGASSNATQGTTP